MASLICYLICLLMNVFDNITTLVSITYVCFWEYVSLFLQHLAIYASFSVDSNGQSLFY